MNNKKNGIPKLRFPGFTGAWEQRKLGDLAEIVRGASPRPISDPKWFDDNSDIGWLRISDVTNQNGRIYYLEQHISKLGQEKTRVITEPHLLLSIAATVGKPLINYIKTGVHDGFLIFLNPKFDLEYMYQWLEMFRPKWNKYGQPGSQVNLNSNLVRKQKIALPSREEQQRISSFLKQLDSLIALHQRKLEHLQEQKKGLLQKMFPKNGEVVPEVRFPGFTDAWEQRKLGEVIVSEHKGKVKSSMKGGNTNYLETNYLNGGIAQKVNATADVSKNDVLILWDGSKAGTVYHGFEGALGSTLKVYVPKCSGDFLYQILKKDQDKIYQRYRTPNIPHVIKNFTEKFIVSIPNVREQEKIAEFFHDLDSLIALHQRKLDHLELMKKGLLQQMFV